MSMFGIQTIPARAPVVDTEGMVKYVVFDGGATIAHRRFAAQSLSQTISIVMDPQFGTIVDPLIMVEASYRVRQTTLVNNSGRPCISSDYDAPRAFPMNNTLINGVITVNGKQFNSSSNRFLSALQRTGITQIDAAGDLSAAYSVFDQSQEYIDLVGSVRNPLASYGSTPNYMASRGMTTLNYVNGTGINNELASEIEFTTYEPLIISPFYGSKNGISNVRQMRLDLQFQDFKRVWSHADGAIVANGLTVELIGFNVDVRFITSKTIVNPRTVHLPYNEVNLLNSNSQALPAGADFTFSINNTTLTSTPSRVVVVCRLEDNDMLYGLENYKRTDTFTRIDNVDVQYGNRTSQLASASPRALYEMSVRNGLKMSFEEYYNQCGSVFIFSPASDIGLGVDDAPSALSQPQMGITVRVRTLGDYAGNRNYVCFAIVVYEGIATFGADGSISSRTGVLSAQDCVSSSMSDRYTVKMPTDNIYGGDMFSGFKNWLGDANKWLKDNKVASDIVKAVDFMPGAMALGTAIDKVGYGVRAGVAAGQLVHPETYLYDMSASGGKSIASLKKSKK